MEGVHRDVVGRSANNIPRRRSVDEKGSQEAWFGTVARVDDARSRGQRGRGRSAQAHADRDGRRSARRDSRLGSLPRLGRGAPRAGGVGAAVWADRPLGDRGRSELGSAHGDVPVRPRPSCAMCARTAHPGQIARASEASPTCSTASGSRARCSRTRCCPRRSSAPARSKARMSSISCWPCGTAGAGRS